MNFIARQKKLAIAMRQAGLDGLLVAHLPNVRYLCGFTGSAGVLLFLVGERSHKARFYTDGRYTQQANEEVKNHKVVIGKRAAFAEGCEGAHKAGIHTLGFEADPLSYIEFKHLGKAVAKTKLNPASAMVET